MNQQTYSIILSVSVILIMIFSIVLYITPSSFNGILYDNVPEGLTATEIKTYTELQDKCFEWNSSWSGDLKTGHCNFDDKVIEPINFTERCGDLYQKYKYTCESTSDGCIEGYVLVQDHWGSDMCYKQDHYDKTLIYCQETQGEFWKHEFTIGGFSCSKMSDSEILNILIQERNE